MTNESFIRSAPTFLVTLGLTLAVLAVTPASAGEDRDQVVLDALTERTDAFCRAVLPAWFAAEHGIATPEVRTHVANCYTGHSRLELLGVESGLTLDGTGLAEIPAVLIRLETGMDLDIYRPLAGRTIRIGPPEK